jgi:hypothetical protein
MLTALLIGALFAIWCVAPITTLYEIRQWAARARSGEDHEELVEAARWVREHVPPDAVVGSWNAGTIGFLSGRHVVNLDGVVNSWSYAQSEHRDLCGYFRATHITYLVDAFEDGTVLTHAEGFADYAPCKGNWHRIWTDGRTGRRWHMEAYRLAP